MLNALIESIILPLNRKHLNRKFNQGNMKQNTNTHLQSLTTEELFYLFKHDGAMDFNKKLTAGRVLHERKYNTKELRRERDLIVESINKEIRDFEDKTALKSKMAAQNKKSVMATTFGSIVPIVIFIYLYIQLEDKNSNDAYFNLGGALFLSSITIYNLYNYNKKLEKLNIEAKDDNITQKQKLDLIAKEWIF